LPRITEAVDTPEDSAEDMPEDLVGEDIRSLRRRAATLEETSTVAIATRRLPVGSIVVTPITAAEDSMAAGDITGVVDTMDPVWGSVSASMRLTDMPLQSAIPPDSMTSTATGNIIQVAPYRTDTSSGKRA